MNSIMSLAAGQFSLLVFKDKYGLMNSYVEMSRSDHVIGDRSRSRDFQKIGINNFFKLFYLMLQNKNDHVHVLKSSWGLSFGWKLHNIMYVLLLLGLFS